MIMLMAQGDGRGISRTVLEQIRLRAVRQMKDGAHPEVLAEALGLNRSTLYGWKLRAEREGERALAAKPHPGGPSALSDTQLEQLSRMITDHDPRDHGFSEHLWTRDIVADLIDKTWGTRFTPQWTGQLLRRMGFTPQRPKYRASEQDSEAVKTWREHTYPEIRAKAVKVRATVYFGDESGVAACHHSGTTWAPVGQTPVVEATASKSRVNMVSAIEQRGRLHFQVSEDSFNAQAFIRFCESLLADDGGKVFLIVDNSRTHHARVVQDYVTGTRGRLTLFFLPAYSPELNPDEQVWKHVKCDTIGRAARRTSKHHLERVRDVLSLLKQTPEKVRSFFRDPHLAYLTVNSV